MGKRITAGIIAALMLFMVAAPGSVVRADGAENVTPGDAARTSSDGDANEDTYIDAKMSEDLRNAAMDAGVDQNGDGKISVAEAEACISLEVYGRYGSTEDPAMKGIEYFCGLQSLTTRGGIYELPDLSSFVNLTRLDVSESQLSRIQGLGKLTNLKYLNISHNIFIRLSDFDGLEKLTGLEYLNMEYLGHGRRDYDYTELPDFSVFKNLTYLNVANNVCETLEGVDQLYNLQELDISCCTHLVEVPDLKGLTCLKSLGASADVALELCRRGDIACLEQLRIIGGGNGVWSEAPESVELSHLKTLQISDTSITKLPEFTGLTNLESLTVYNNNSLTELPEFTGLTNLKSLTIFGNASLAELPELTRLANLEKLHLTNCALTELPKLSGLKKLKSLSIFDNNDLIKLPEFDNWANLEELCLEYINVSELPDLRGCNKLNPDHTWFRGTLIAESEARAKLPQHLLEDTEWFEEQWFGRRNIVSGRNVFDAAMAAGADTDEDGEISMAEVEACTRLTISKLSNKYDSVGMKSIAGIGIFRNLKELKIEGGGIRYLSQLTALASLEKIDVSNNQLTILPNLKGHINLSTEGSDFSGNQIYESEARAKLPQQLLDDAEWFERQGFLKDEVPEPEPQPQPDPEPEPEPQPGDKYEIDLGDGKTGIGSDAFEELLKKNKHCTVEINLDNGVRFSFEMGSMHVVEGKDVYDFGCTLIRNYEKLPPAMQNVIRSNSFVTRILYNYSGKLPGTVSIRIYVGQQYAGQTLYYYRENKDNTFTFMQEALVDADGYITVQQDHCSDYVLLGEKRENNTPGGLGTDTPSGTTPDSPSGLTPDTTANGTPGTSSDSAPGTATDVLTGTANPLPVTQAASALAGSTTAPKTGDDNAVAVHMMLLLVGMTGILTACIGIAGRRRRVSPGRKR